MSDQMSAARSERRFGRFRVAEEFLNTHEDESRDLFARMQLEVLQMQTFSGTGIIEYLGVSPMFEPMDFGQLVWVYEILLMRVDDSVMVKVERAADPFFPHALSESVRLVPGMFEGKSDDSN